MAGGQYWPEPLILLNPLTRTDASYSAVGYTPSGSFGDVVQDLWKSTTECFTKAPVCEEQYDQENISSLVKRDVIAWREHLRSAGLAASTINNHMASLSGIATWVQAQDATAFVMGDPT